MRDDKEASSGVEDGGWKRDRRDKWEKHRYTSRFMALTEKWKS